MTGHDARAWVLYPGDSGPSELVLEEIRIDPVRPNEVLAAPLYGCWEGNMGHAVARVPVDICRVRNEPKVVIGNAGVVRVLETGTDVTSVRPGQNAMVFPSGVSDERGYMLKALGFDAPGQIGLLATKMKLTDRQFIPIPTNTRFTLAQWAAFSVRYITAWSNWRMAYGVFRLQMDENECPSPHTWGWGGGTTLAELDLARRHGCTVVMVSGKDRNLDMIRRLGIEGLDRKQFEVLEYDEERFRSDREYRASYKRSEVAFIGEVKRRTNHEMVQIFLDYVGAPVYRLTLKALSRQGVLATAGWKKGMHVSHLRSQECISRHQHIYTHYARLSQGLEAMQYAEASGWMAEPDQRIYGFDEIPELARDYAQDLTGYFPCYAVNPE
ncbi:MAG: zinc-binding dehydrogenase [Acidobacteriota bacterium]|nr:zinc-binding dehydrogenase [Acidobacteriota bacterium]